MNRKYKFSWKRRIFWRTSMVVGHKYIEDQDKMILYLDDGSLREIKKWLDCECKLGADWVNMTKDSISEEAGK